MREAAAFGPSSTPAITRTSRSGAAVPDQGECGDRCRRTGPQDLLDVGNWTPHWLGGRAASSAGHGVHVDPADWSLAWLADLHLAEDRSYLVMALSVECDGRDLGWREIPEVGRHAVDRALRSHRLEGLVGSDAGEVVLVLAVADRDRAASAGRLLTDDATSLVHLAGSRWHLCIGLTGAAERGSSVMQRVREARMACRIGRMLRGPDAVTRFSDLGAFPAIVDAVCGQGGNAFGELHERYLGSLVRYEERTGLPLVQTLSVLFDENGNVSGTARSLGINRQSLLYRLHKIEAMCGLDLADASDRFALELAVRSWAIRVALANSRGITGQRTCGAESLSPIPPRAAQVRQISRRVGTGARAAAG